MTITDILWCYINSDFFPLLFLCLSLWCLHSEKLFLSILHTTFSTILLFFFYCTLHLLTMAEHYHHTLGRYYCLVVWGKRLGTWEGAAGPGWFSNISSSAADCFIISRNAAGPSCQNIGTDMYWQWMPLGSLFPEHPRYNAFQAPQPLELWGGSAQKPLGGA